MPRESGGGSAGRAVTYRDRAGAAAAPLPAWWTHGRRVLRRRVVLGALALLVGGVVVELRGPRADVPPADGVRRLVGEEAAGGLDAERALECLLGLALLGLGGVTLGVGFFDAWARLDERRVREALGVGARGDGNGNALSADGRRRGRIEPRASRAAAPPGAYVDELDELGRVLRSLHGFPALGCPPFPEVRERLAARLPRPSGSGRHARLVPDPVTGRLVEQVLGDASFLALDVRDDGVLLVRFSESSEPVGATWHASRAEADEQIADEYGVRELWFRDAPLDGEPSVFLAAVAS